MIIKCIHDFQECQKIWEKLSPHETIYDEWEFRSAFNKYTNYQLYFYIGLIKDQIIGLLPLQYNSPKKALEFFGGPYMDINQIFIEEKNYQYIPQFYKALDYPAKLVLTQKDTYTQSLDQDNFNYSFNLSNYHSLEDFFKNLFSKKRQKNFKRENKMIEEKKIKIISDQYQDLDLLIQLNIEKFGKESSFSDSDHPQIFHDLLKLPWKLIMFSFEINNQKQAITLGLLYKNIYYYLASGVNSEISNLGNYVILKNIEKAISLKAKTFDLGSDDCGWKERWHAEKNIPQYIYSTILNY
jgi:CelD/BcsL family acetyltransferase involved in cellulose biosynthesis